MKHKVRLTVIDKKLYPELQQQYCADPDMVAGGPKMPHCSDGTRPVIFKIERIDYE